MNSRNTPAGCGLMARLRRCLSAAGRRWDHGCEGTALVLRAIGRDLVTGLALTGASGFYSGWPVQGRDVGSDAPRSAPRRTERT